MDDALPTCPRCGYDLSAEVGKWGEACPLAGRCWECGLAVAWADLLRADRRVLPRFVEHAQRVGVLAAAWRTWWWAVRPWVFWSRVRMEHEPRAWRMLAWVVLVVCAAWAAHGAAWAVVLWWQHGWGWLVTNGESLSGWMAPVGSMAVSWTPGRNTWLATFVPAWKRTTFGQAYLPLLAMSVVLVVMMLVLPHTRARAKVRGAHVARAGVYSLAWMLPMMLLGPTLRALSLWLIGNGFATPLVTTGWRGFLPLYHWGYCYLLLGAGWLGVWWWWALARGWKLESPVRVWVAANVAGLLAMTTVLTVDGQFAWLLSKV
ncbi:MAG: hypothetical protein SFY69_07070 [Planctomycetota bacterium]|nr:hypothetical protein [Planctomycetota bacterium]